jgi:hypothetical protein
MNDRLKQISLRKFRIEIVDLHEVVEVSRRDPGGNIQILGYWTPYATYPSDSKSLPPLEIPTDGPKMIRSPEEASVAVAPSPVRAVPKPSQRRGR